MDKTLFEELVGSLKEAKAIAKGRAKPCRRFEVTAPDAKAAREQTRLSQGDYAQRGQVGQVAVGPSARLVGLRVGSGSATMGCRPPASCCRSPASAVGFSVPPLHSWLWTIDNVHAFALRYGCMQSTRWQARREWA